MVSATSIFDLMQTFYFIDFFLLDPISKGQLASNDAVNAATIVPWIFCVLFLIIGGVVGHFVSRHYTKNAAFPGEHRNQLSW